MSLKYWWIMKNTVCHALKSNAVIELLPYELRSPIGAKVTLSTYFAKVQSTKVGNSIVAVVTGL